MSKGDRRAVFLVSMIRPMAELESLFLDCFSREEGQRLTQSHYPSLESRQLDLEMSYLSPLDKLLTRSSCRIFP